MASNIFKGLSGIMRGKIEKELVMPDNVNAVAEIINRHDVAMSLMKSYRE